MSSTDALTAEQQYLQQARAALRRMRDRAADLDASLTGDWVSTEYLKSTLLQRMRALEDDPDVPLFFGRLDLDATHRGEHFYVGRRHVTDERGDPMVVDWRAPVSRRFYQASPQRPLGVTRRRRFGFTHGKITAYEDEPLAGASADEPTQPHSNILEEEIERPRTGPMRDIVATIQPEQDEIVRADLTTDVCVQGAPGTGKTAVGLHRAAYLLYAHRDQLTRQGVLVVGPNESFLRYIADVLPALGEIDAKQTTIEQLVAHVPLRGYDDTATARVKGDTRMVQVLHRALWSMVGTATEALVVPRGSRRWRVPAYEANEIVAELRSREVRYDAGRAMLPQRLAHHILVKMENAGDAPDDRTQAAVARSKPVKAYADRLWPAVDARRLVMRILGEPDHLAAAAADILTPAEQQVIAWSKPARGPGSARWSLHDAVLVDEARDLLQRTPSLGHVVIDEAQDLSPMMLRAVGRHCSTGSSTVLGDLAQATTPWGVTAWDTALHSLGKPAAHVQELTTGFRVPGEVIDLAARLLPQIAPTLARPRSIRREQGHLTIEGCKQPLAAAVDAVRRVTKQPGSVGLIVADHLTVQTESALRSAGLSHSVLGNADDIESRVDVVPAPLAKGLEFDHVVLVEPADIVAAEPDEVTGLRRLYVCLTRAVTSLCVVHAKALPFDVAGRSRRG